MRRTAMKRLRLFVFHEILVTAYALTVEAPAKEIQVARGNNVTLRCHFKTQAPVVPGDVVVWTKINSADDAVTRYFDGLVQYGKGYENRIQFSGDLNKGDISITINAVTMEDNGTYACTVRLRNDPPRQTAALALLVLVAPSNPECKILGTAEYGQTINLTCISHEGSPKPRYTWQSFNVQNEPRVLQTTEGSKKIEKNPPRRHLQGIREQRMMLKMNEERSRRPMPSSGFAEAQTPLQKRNQSLFLTAGRFFWHSNMKANGSAFKFWERISLSPWKEMLNIQ
ncbi:cell surface A33 antigen isoform 2-T2 [Spheniscus humboldti]